MPARLNTSVVGVLVLAAATGSGTMAADCPGIAAATTAASQWESRRTIQLSVTVRSELLTDFCHAVSAVSQQHQVDSTRIDAVAPSAISDYLDRVSRSDIPPRTLEATLGEKLGFAGLSRPVADRYGRLTVHYTRAVLYLNFDGIRHEPFPEFLVVAGSISMEGYADGKKVCTARITVPPAGSVSVTC